MIFFIGNDGTVINSVPSPVYQGSAGVNDIYVVAPFASNLQATVAFKLPNGVYTERYPMKLVNEITELVNKKTGQMCSGWQFSMPNNITEYFGTVTAQFFFYSAQQGKQIACSATTFTVGRGVPPILPDRPTDDVYELILVNIAALQQDIKNVTSKAVVIWGFNILAAIFSFLWLRWMGGPKERGTTSLQGSTMRLWSAWKLLRSTGIKPVHTD